MESSIAKSLEDACQHSRSGFGELKAHQVLSNSVMQGQKAVICDWRARDVSKSTGYVEEVCSLTWWSTGVERVEVDSLSSRQDAKSARV